MPLVVIIVVVFIFFALKEALGEQGLWILAGAIVLGVCSLFIMLIMPTATDDEKERSWKEQRLMLNELEKKAASILENLSLKFAKKIPVSRHRNGLIGFHGNELVVAIVSISKREMSYHLDEERIALKDIVDVDWDHRNEQRTRSEKVSGSDQEFKNKSTLGRAVVGGVVMGPLGVVAGAASAGGPKVVKKDPDKRKVEYTYTHKPRLIIHVDRDEKPFVYLEMNSADDASEMAKLIAHHVKISQADSQT